MTCCRKATQATTRFNPVRCLVSGLDLFWAIFACGNSNVQCSWLSFARGAIFTDVLSMSGGLFDVSNTSAWDGGLAAGM